MVDRHVNILGNLEYSVKYLLVKYLTNDIFTIYTFLLYGLSSKDLLLVHYPLFKNLLFYQFQTK